MTISMTTNTIEDLIEAEIDQNREEMVMIAGKLRIVNLTIEEDLTMKTESQSKIVEDLTMNVVLMMIEDLTTDVKQMTVRDKMKKEDNRVIGKVIEGETKMILLMIDDVKEFQNVKNQQRRDKSPTTH